MINKIIFKSINALLFTCTTLCRDVHNQNRLLKDGIDIFYVTCTFQILKRDVYTCMRRTCSYIPLMKQNVTCKRVQRSI